MNIKRILISTLLIASVTSMTSCDMTWDEFIAKRGSSANASAKQTVYAPELDPGVHELITDQRFKSLENDEPVRFETAVTPEEAENGTAVELRDDSGQTISKMYDNGKHGDRIAGDGIYTCTYNPKAKGEDTFSYTANIGGTDTNSAQVRYFDKITDQDYTNMNNVQKNFMEIQSKYIDSNGYVPNDKKTEALDAIGEYAKELYNNGEAVEYRVNKDYGNVVVKLSSGITCVYANPDETSMAGGPASVSTTSASSSSTIVAHQIDVNIFQPFFSQFPHDIESQVRNLPCSEFPGDCTISTTLKNASVLPTSIQNFGANQMILWEGHGDFDGSLHSFLLSGIVFNDADYSDDDLIEDRIAIEAQRRMRFEEAEELWPGRYTIDDIDPTDPMWCIYPAITSKYVDKYCPDMTNSFLYMGACLTAHDSVLAASFINKNCNVVIGYTEVVDYRYEKPMLDDLLLNMCQHITYPVSGAPAIDYNPIITALDLAKEKNGEDDSRFKVGSDYPPAKPAIFGNRLYKFADVIKDDLADPVSVAAHVNGSLRLGTNYIRLHVGESGTLPVASMPSNCNKLYWTIADEHIATVDENGRITALSARKTDRDGNIINNPYGNAVTTTGRVATEDGLNYVDFAIQVYE